MKTIKYFFKRLLLLIPAYRKRVQRKVMEQYKAQEEAFALKIIQHNINEWNLIQAKKSTLSAKERKRVEEFVMRLEDDGVITVTDKTELWK